jgi:hypothetical protein
MTNPMTTDQPEGLSAQRAIKRLLNGDRAVAEEDRASTAAYLTELRAQNTQRVISVWADGTWIEEGLPDAAISATTNGYLVSIPLKAARTPPVAQDGGEAVERLRRVAAGPGTINLLTYAPEQAANDLRALLAERDKLAGALKSSNAKLKTYEDAYHEADIQAETAESALAAQAAGVQQLVEVVEAIQRGYGVNHTSKWARDTTAAALSNLNPTPSTPPYDPGINQQKGGE